MSTKPAAPASRTAVVAPKATPPKAGAANSAAASAKMHRRSRSGCFTCRLRRKKCDEAKPACKACKHLGLKCEYKRPVWWGNNEQRKNQKELIKNIIKRTKVSEKTQGSATGADSPPGLSHSLPTSATYSDAARTRGVSVDSQYSLDCDFGPPPPCAAYDPYGPRLFAPPPAFPQAGYEVDIKTERQMFVNDVPTRRDSSISTFSTFQPPPPARRARAAARGGLDPAGDLRGPGRPVRPRRRPRLLPVRLPARPAAGLAGGRHPGRRLRPAAARPLRRPRPPPHLPHPRGQPARLGPVRADPPRARVEPLLPALLPQHRRHPHEVHAPAAERADRQRHRAPPLRHHHRALRRPQARHRPRPHPRGDPGHDLLPLLRRPARGRAAGHPLVPALPGRVQPGEAAGAAGRHVRLARPPALQHDPGGVDRHPGRDDAGRRAPVRRRVPEHAHGRAVGRPLRADGLRGSDDVHDLGDRLPGGAEDRPEPGRHAALRPHQDARRADGLHRGPAGRRRQRLLAHRRAAAPPAVAQHDRHVPRRRPHLAVLAGARLGQARQGDDGPGHPVHLAARVHPRRRRRVRPLDRVAHAAGRLAEHVHVGLPPRLRRPHRLPRRAGRVRQLRPDGPRAAGSVAGLGPGRADGRGSGRPLAGRDAEPGLGFPSDLMGLDGLIQPEIVFPANLPHPGLILFAPDGSHGRRVRRPGPEGERRMRGGGFGPRRELGGRWHDGSPAL